MDRMRQAEFNLRFDYDVVELEHLWFISVQNAERRLQT